MKCIKCGGSVLTRYDETVCINCGFEPDSLRPHMEPTFSARVMQRATFGMPKMEEAK